MTTYSDTLISHLSRGDIAVMRTDTIYGVVGRADLETTVERVYQTKGRTPTKSPIILIAHPSQMFDTYDPSVLAEISTYWPGPNSIILPSNNGPAWITRGNNSIAYRIPAVPELRNLLEQTGPLIAPSANPEGLPPANTIEEARAYFGTSVDHYEDGGVVKQTAPSSLYRYENGAFEKLR